MLVHDAARVPGDNLPIAGRNVQRTEEHCRESLCVFSCPHSALLARWPTCRRTRTFIRMNQPRCLSHRGIFAAALTFCAMSNTLAAQCPEGTPPPCKSASPAAGRRVYPALNPRTWIVVPFGNVTKSPELDWLRDASVNLLSLDLSRWSDIIVINDKRIGDLVRELPAARSAGVLTLNDGLSLALRSEIAGSNRRCACVRYERWLRSRGSARQHTGTQR